MSANEPSNSIGGPPREGASPFPFLFVLPLAILLSPLRVSLLLISSVSRPLSGLFQFCFSYSSLSADVVSKGLLQILRGIYLTQALRRRLAGARMA